MRTRTPAQQHRHDRQVRLNRANSLRVRIEHATRACEQWPSTRLESELFAMTRELEKLAGCRFIGSRL